MSQKEGKAVQSVAEAVVDIDLSAATSQIGMRAVDTNPYETGIQTDRGYSNAFAAGRDYLANGVERAALILFEGKIERSGLPSENFSKAALRVADELISPVKAIRDSYVEARLAEKNLTWRGADQEGALASMMQKMDRRVSARERKTELAA